MKKHSRLIKLEGNVYFVDFSRSDARLNKDQMRAIMRKSGLGVPLTIEEEGRLQSFIELENKISANQGQVIQVDFKNRKRAA